MADDLKDEIKLSVDASGVETGVNSAKRSISSLGETVSNVGKRGGDGLAQIGRSGEDAGRKVEQTTRNMVNSLQRQIAAAEAGSTSTRQYYESIGRLRGANMDVLKPYLDQLDQAKEKTQAAAAATGGLGNAAALAGRALAAVGIAATVKEFVGLADASTNMNSRLKLVTGSAEELASVQERLFSIAQNARVSFTDLVGTYAQVARSTKDLGVSQQSLLTVIDTISKSVTISGGSAQSAQAALVQLSQGFASGALRGEELNSVMEQTPRLAQAIADGLGVSIGKLREMGKEGELTAEKVLGALEKSAASVQDEFSKMAVTVEQATTNAGNSLLKFVGALDKVTGASSITAKAIQAVSSAIAFVASDIEKLGMQEPLRAASAEVLALHRRATLLKNGMAAGFYPPSFQRELDDVNARLEKAKKNFNDVNAQMGGARDPRDQSGFRSRSDSAAAEAARQSGLRDSADAFRLKLDGVPTSYIKDMGELVRLHASGAISTKDYQEALAKMQATLHKAPAGAAAGVRAARQVEETYKTLVSSINEKIRAESDELAQGSRVSASQQMAIKIDEQVKSGKLKLTAARRAELDAMLRVLGALEQEGVARKQEAKATAQRVKDYEAEVKAAEALLKAQQASTKSVEDSLQKAKDEERAHLMAAESGITLAEATERLALARAEENYQKAVGAGADGETLLALQREIEARKGLVAVMQDRGVRDANAKAADEAAKKWEQTSKLIGDTLADYIMGGGKDAASYLKRLFATLVLQPTVNYLASGVMGWLGLGGGGSGGSGGSGVMGMANNASSLNTIYGAGSQFLYGGAAGASTASLGYANAVGMFGGDSIGALYAANGGWAGVGAGTGGAGAGAGAGIGAAGWAAGILAIPALGWYFADKFDKGDSFSGAAYATSGGDDRVAQVTPGALNPNMDTGDLPDREAMKARLREMGAPESSMEGLNDRSLHRMMILGETSQRQSGGDVSGGGLMNWDEWSKNNKDLPDFYRGPGYASPEELGWYEVQDRGSRDVDRQWDSYHTDPRVTEASRQLALGILAPIKSISDMLGNDSDYKVATGMAYNDKTGKITGGLQIWEDEETKLNWGSKEFDNQGEYLRATFTDSLGVLETMDGVPEWLKKQVDGAQAEMAKLEGEKIGEEAAQIYTNAANSITATYSQIKTLIDIIPDLAGASQDAVFSIGEAFGGLGNYTSAYQGYIQNYYSDDERAGYVRGGINSSLSAHGLSVDENTTRDDYRKMIEAQDLTTESGRKAYAALIMASDAFAQITPAAEDAAKAAEDAAKALAFMDDLLKTRVDLEAEWAAITGDVAGAERMRREQAIKGMKEEEIAQYDANEALRTRIETEKEFQSTISGIGSSLTNVLAESLLGNLTGADLGGQMADAVIGGVYNALANNAAQQITDMMMNTIIDPLVRAALVGSLTAETVSQAAIDNMVAHAKVVIEALGAVFNDPVFKGLMADLNVMFKDIAGSAPAQPYYSSYVSQQKSAQKEIADATERAAEQVKNAWEGVGDSLMDQVKKIRGDLAGDGDGGMAYWQSQFAIETAKARSGDVDAANGLNALSGSLLDAAGNDAATQLELQQMRAWVAQSLQDTAGYANAFAGGAPIAPIVQMPRAMPAYVPPTTSSQGPVVVAADPGLVSEVRELKAIVRLLSDQQLEGLRIERRRETLGTPVYEVEAP